MAFTRVLRASTSRRVLVSLTSRTCNLVRSTSTTSFKMMISFPSSVRAPFTPSARLPYSTTLRLSSRKRTLCTVHGNLHATSRRSNRYIPKLAIVCSNRVVSPLPPSRVARVALSHPGPLGHDSLAPQEAPRDSDSTTRSRVTMLRP